MRAFNSPRTLVPIVLLIVYINFVASRSISDDGEVIDKKVLEERGEGGVREEGIGDKSDSDGSEEGIRRFDAVIEESEKEVERQDQRSSGDSEVSAKEDADGGSEVMADDATADQRKRSVKRKLDEVEADGETISVSKHDEEIVDESEVSKEGMGSNGVVEVRQIPELIPVKIDHISPYEPNFGGEDAARKSLGVVDEEEKNDDDEGEGEVRSERSSEKKEEVEGEGAESIVQKWKQQAMELQGQLKNRTFFQYLKEQASEVLPDIPRFTEIQLLKALKTISSRKSSGSEDSYIRNLNTSGLNDKQLEIIECAEGLVAEKQRQSFSENIIDCVRGLDILNCMRIFIWPIIAENVPERIMQSFPTLPIEVSLSDFLPNRQGEHSKIIRGVHQQRLLMPETVVANILKDALAAGPHDENIPTQIDPENFAKLLTPGQLDILKMAEKFLPESVRQEYSSKMHSCVRRFEYFSCVKYFTWPIVKQYYPALPEFPDYQTWYPSSISVYPGYPIVPFPDLSDNNGQLPEVIEADGLVHRTPRPETIIFQLLRNTVDEQPRHQGTAEIYALPDTGSMTPEQLASIQMAQQLVPVSHRAEFVDKTTKCIQEYNYLFCTKYSTWPTLKQFQPRLPAFTDLESAFGNLFSKLPNFGSFFSGDSGNKKNLTAFFGGLPWAGAWTGGSGSQGGSGSGGGGQGSGSVGSGDSSGGTGYPSFPGAAGSGGGSYIPGFPGAGGSGGGGYIPGFPGGGSQIPGFPGAGGSGGGGQIPGVGGSGGYIPGIGESGGHIPDISNVGSGGSNIPNPSGGSFSWPGIPGIKPPGTITWGGAGGSGPSGSSSSGGSGSGSSGTSGGSLGGSGQSGGGGTSGPSIGNIPWTGGQGSGSSGSGGPSGPSIGGSGQSGGGGSSIPSNGNIPWTGGQGSGSSGSGAPSGASTGGSGQPGGGGSSIPPIGNIPWTGGQGSGSSSGGAPSGASSGGSGQSGGGASIPPNGNIPWTGGQESGSSGSSGPSGSSSGGYGQSGGGGSIIPSIGNIPWTGGQGSGSSGSGAPSGSLIPSIGNIPWTGGQGSGSSGSGAPSGASTGGSEQSGGGSSIPPNGNIPWTGGQGSGSSGSDGASGSSSGGYGQSGGGGSPIPSIGNIPWTGGQGSGSSAVSGPSGSPSSGPGQTGGGGSSIPSIGNIPWTGGQGSGSSSSGSPSGSSSGGYGQSGGGSSSIPGGGTISWGGGNGGSYRPDVGGGVPTTIPNLPGLGEQGGGGSGSSGGSSGSLQGPGSPSGSSSSGSGQSVSSSIPGGGTVSWSGGNSYQPKPYKLLTPEEADGSSKPLSRAPAETLQQKSLEAKIIDILYNLRYTIPESPLTPIPMGGPRAVLAQLNEDQMIILSLAKSIIPPPMRPDFASQTVGCLQGGSNFLGCTKNVIWPFLKFYIPNIPAFPDDKPQLMENHSAELDFIPGRHYSLEPVSYAPFISQHQLSQLFRQPIQILGRSPLRSEISAKADDQPIISVTDPKFVPIYTDHPDTVVLKILSAMADSVEQSNPPDYRSRIPAFITFYSTLNSSLNDEQERILKATEYLIPESSRQEFFNEMLVCLIDNAFQTCARDNIWPALAKHYPRIPSFPNFQENSLQDTPSLSEDYRRISETDVKTGHHGDTVVTITDTRFVPIFSDHPEEIILKMLKGVQPSSLNQINTPPSSIAKSPSYVSAFTKPQGDILVVAENLLPESIRDIFVMRMSECVRDNSFLDCTRDIAWPTIGQFFPRLPSFPNFGTLPSLSEGKPQQPTLLPPVLDTTAPIAEFPRINHHEHNQLQQLPETLESKLEGILAAVSGLRVNTQSGISYLNTEDPLTSALITDKQVKIIKMAEGLIPEEARPMFIVKMMGCVRKSGFPICSQAVAWPTLRQFVPNVPEFPDISNFLPELPELPDFSTFQEQLPDLSNFSQVGQGLGQFTPQFQQPPKSPPEFPGQHGVLLPGYTASVGPASVVPAFPGQPTDILVDISQDRVTFPEPKHQPLERQRREVINLLEDEPLRINEAPLNITESDLLELLVNVTKSNAAESSGPPEESVVQSLNSTIKESLTPQQLAILTMVEKLVVQNSRGVMGQVIRCITGLSFIRCMGIFMWPVITSTVPSLLGIQLPFGRSTQDTDDLFGVSVEELEKELLDRKEEMEHTLFDWYKSLTQEKFQSTLGFIKFEGYGDGEIGIKFTGAREGRAKIKDHKNLPSILTIISDIMEDVLDTGKGSHKTSKDKRKGRGLIFPLNENFERSNNDENIINMFLQRLKTNATDEDLHLGNRRLTPEDAYRAFEVLFGPRLKARLVKKLLQLQENGIDLNDSHNSHEEQQEESSQSSQRLRVIPLDVQEKKSNLFNEIREEQDNIDANGLTSEENPKSGLIIHLPKLDDEIISRKTSDSLTSLARHMNKNNMFQMIPGIGFAMTFILQMALAHARAAASMATMLSNMAMGTAMFSLVRQAIFGQSNHPKIKYVYDTDGHGPGIKHDVRCYLLTRMIPCLHVLLLGLVLSALGGYVPPGPRYTCPKEPIYIYPCTCERGTDRGLYVRCENTNLASLSLAFINLGNEPAPIEVLTLYKCDIARWYGPALYPLNIRVLRIIDTPLKSIEEHSFLGVNRTLQELHIIRSRLEKFPKEAFQILGNLSDLIISGHKLNVLPGNGFGGSLASAKLERLEISNGILSSLPSDALTPLKKLKFLDLHGNKIEELKRNQFKGLRDTEFLDLSDNLISKLDPSHLADLTKMGWCNMSRNAIGELKRGTFARNSVLKVLNLSHNKIRKLDSNTFRGMRFLRRLFLSDNQINDVGRGTFGSVTRIGTIDLARNQIKKIDFQMFNQLQYAELLDVSENAVTIIEKLAFKDLFLARVNLSHNEISKIEGGAFENCANITVLDLSYNKLDNISKYAFDSSTYATELQLSYNLLTALNQVPLHNMTGLKVLNVTHNNIQSVPRQTFPKLYELHTIDLAYNNLSEIHNGIFQTLFSLRFLNLSHNSLEKIRPSTFGPLTTLLHLDMSHNKLTDIARGSLARLSSCQTLSVRNNKLTKIFQLPIPLGYLDFSDNDLEEIPTIDVWPSMNALLSLDLSKNRLSDSLQHGSFQPLLTLRTLNLQGNNITVPPWAALSTLTSLQYLYMQDNHLTSLGKSAFGLLPIVFELNLANNNIKNLNPRAFEGLLQLLTLNLTNNDIGHIPNGAFQGLVSLRTLDLSHNHIEKLDNKTHGLLDDCLSLERINLSHNKFSFITRKTFPNDPYIPYRLKEVDLSYNLMPVLTYDITIGTKKVGYMNLSHNNINEIRRHVIGNMTSVHTLDLSYNDLSDISERDVFAAPDNLTNLHLANNHFTSLPMKKITAMPKLKLLDIENNEFSDFDLTFMKLINNDTELRYEGNPLNCNCHARPLKRWITTLTEVPSEWRNVVCASPDYIAGKALPFVTEELMTCDENEIAENTDLQITPDVKFRQIEYDEEDKSWKITWYVTSRGDIGDFYLVVRELGGSKPIIEKDIVYKERSYKIRDIPESQAMYELCVLARDSIGNVKHFRNSQCQVLNKQPVTSSTTSISCSGIASILVTIFIVAVM
ncbi:uncharacterized protein LOC107036999 [Diachasma alloeum]|uniref:uncharacterized protein LOC107036999 n=1 Tax=Diachasma alloeum TaxID=454923 RepID=UPI0010FB2D7C|nr:uncharacterized protein LOC107036999 [Diachasma alloeum]